MKTKYPTEFPITIRTAQEIMGDPWIADREMKAGKFRTPTGVFRKEISIEEANAERVRIGFVPALPVRAATDNDDAVLSLERLDLVTGEAVRPPQVLLRDRETGALTPAPELTKIFYQDLREKADRYRGTIDPLEQAWMDSYLVEPEVAREIEGSNPPEGVKNT